MSPSDPILTIGGFEKHQDQFDRGPSCPNESRRIPSLQPFFRGQETSSWCYQGECSGRDETPSTDVSLSSPSFSGISNPLSLPLLPPSGILNQHRHSVASVLSDFGHGVNNDFPKGAMTARTSLNKRKDSYFYDEGRIGLFDGRQSDSTEYIRQSHANLPCHINNNNEFHSSPLNHWNTVFDSDQVRVNSFPAKWSNFHKASRSHSSNILNINDQNLPSRDQRIPNFLYFPEKPCSRDASNEIIDRFSWSSSDQNAPLSVFVGNIPKSTSPDAFHRLMSLKGTVEEVVCDFRPNCWLTAFVTYSKPSESAKAVEFFNNRRAIKAAPPHRLVCCFAPHPPASLCCSPIPTCSPQELQSGSVPVLPFFPKFGSNKSDQPLSFRRIFALPRFSLLKDGPLGANLFIYGIPSDWTEVTLMRLCQEFGNIVGIRVPGAPTAGPQRLNKGFGFVSYDSTESSARALEGLSGREFLGKPLNIQLKLGEQLSVHSQLKNQSNPINQGNSLNQDQRLQKYWYQHSSPTPISSTEYRFLSESCLNLNPNGQPISSIRSPSSTSSDICPCTPRNPSTANEYLPLSGSPYIPLRSSPNAAYNRESDMPGKQWITTQQHSAIDYGNTTTPDEQQPITTPTTASSTATHQSRTLSLRPPPSEFASMMFSDHTCQHTMHSPIHSIAPNPSIIDDNQFQSIKTANEETRSSLLNLIDSSLNGFVCPHSNDSIDINTLNETPASESHGNGTSIFPDLLGAEDVELWKVLEHQWNNDKGFLSFFELLNGQSSSINDMNLTNTLEELKIKDASPSHEDIKALFEHWRNSSLTRNSINNESNNNDIWRMSFNTNELNMTSSSSLQFRHSNQVEAEFI